MERELSTLPKLTKTWKRKTVLNSIGESNFAPIKGGGADYGPVFFRQENP